MTVRTLQSQNSSSKDLTGLKLTERKAKLAAIGEQSALPGDPDDNSGNNVGAVYEFARDIDGNWSQTGGRF